MLCRNNAERGWLLLLYISVTFAPENIQAYKCLLRFMREQEAIVPVAKACADKMERTQSTQSRGVLPSLLEMDALKHSKPIQIVVQLSNGVHTGCTVENSSTTQEVTLAILRLLGLPKSILSQQHLPYALYDVYHGNEKLLAPNTIIFDVIAKWEEYGTMMSQRNIPTSFSFLLKKFLYLSDTIPENASELELEFHQVLLLLS
jgi:hypothetical protein